MYIKRFIFICLSLLFLLIVFRGNVYAASGYQCDTKCQNPVADWSPPCGDNTCPFPCGGSGFEDWTSAGSAVACGEVLGNRMWCCSWSDTCCTYCSPGDCGTAPPAEVCGNGSCAGSETCSTCPADCGACCSNSDPAAPVLSSPVNGTQILKNVSRSFVWTHTDWGTNCSGNSNSYTICFGASCYSSGTTTSYSWTPAVVGSIPWNVNANNGAASATSLTWNVCVEGFVSSSTTYVPNITWGTCNSSHQRIGTRTCMEDCVAVDDCNAYMITPAACPAGSSCSYNAGTKIQTITEDCVGTITGTLFDASDVAGCTAGEISASPKFGGVTFGISPTPDPLKWPIISGSAPNVTTNGSGVYSQSVYASETLPANYIFDYTALISSGLAAGVKTECGMSMAAVTAIGQTVTKDTGFWKVYGGWWQAVGGSVYAKSGVQSFVPASAAAADQKLIKASSVALGSRTGVLTYGTAWTGLELGTNPNMLLTTGVSDDQWRAESEYGGLRYDYNFFNTRMDVFASTVWDFGSINYDDGGVGYQIFKHTGNASLIYGGPTGTQKVILLVDGDVNILSNIIVPDGAFLAVIASGNINVASNVSSVQGWFVAENINVPCIDTTPADGACDKTDVQFLGEGSFVGWTGINLTRDRGIANNLEPSEKFTYRPDMAINAPSPILIYTRQFSPFIP